MSSDNIDDTNDISVYNENDILNWGRTDKRRKDEEKKGKKGQRERT